MAVDEVSVPVLVFAYVNPAVAPIAGALLILTGSVFASRTIPAGVGSENVADE
ncbi:hypothetical protein ACQ86B_10440 [Mycolicibacterium aichiense]|uniref:hypothetical protein n=1 Tax=Mycolicibacterium aichiense TaxID=1799 RepID=UPI003D6730D0